MKTNVLIKYDNGTKEEMKLIFELLVDDVLLIFRTFCGILSTDVEEISPHCVSDVKLGAMLLATVDGFFHIVFF